MGDTAIQIILTYGHVLSAIGWLGLAFAMNFTIGPLMQSFSPSTRSELIIKFIPRFTRVTATFAGSTIVFGLLLYASFYPDIPNAQILGVGVLIALVAFGLGVGRVLPMSGRLTRMAKAAAESGTPPPPEFAPTLKAVQLESLLSMVLLLVVVALMVTVAGY